MVIIRLWRRVALVLLVAAVGSVQTQAATPSHEKVKYDVKERIEANIEAAGLLSVSSVEVLGRDVLTEDRVKYRVRITIVRNTRMPTPSGLESLRWPARRLVPVPAGTKMLQESSVLYRLSAAGQWFIQDMARISQNDSEFVRAFAEIDKTLREQSDAQDFALAKNGSLGRSADPLLQKKESLVRYLSTHPTGKHTAEARVLLKAEEEQLQSRRDQIKARNALTLAECQQVIGDYVQAIQKGDFNVAMAMTSDITGATAIYQARGDYAKQGQRVTLPTITGVKVYLEHPQDIRATLASERHGEIQMQKRPGSAWRVVHPILER